MSKVHKAILKIDPQEVIYPNRLLSQTERSADHGDLIRTFTVKFQNRPEMEADIKVCNGDGPFLDPVLFCDGQEVDLIQDPSDDVRGEYHFEHQGETFVVNVVSE